MKHECDKKPKDFTIERINYTYAERTSEWIASEWFEGEHITGIHFCPFCGSGLNTESTNPLNAEGRIRSILANKE